MSITLNILIFLGLTITMVARCELKSDALTSEIEAFVRERLRGSTDSLVVEFRSIPSHNVTSCRKTFYRVVAENGVALRGNIHIPVELICNDRVAHRLVVSVKVRTFGKALIAASQIGRHATVDESDIRIQNIETTTLVSDFLSDTRKLIRMRSRRIIPEGKILSESMFEPLPLVRQGDALTLRVKARSVTLSVKAVAKEDGGKGDVVLVQKAGSPEKFRARIIDANTVELNSH